LKSNKYPELFLHEVDLTQHLPKFSKGDWVWVSVDKKNWRGLPFEKMDGEKFVTLDCQTNSNGHIVWTYCEPYENRPF
jgi:hypothetical protein